MNTLPPPTGAPPGARDALLATGAGGARPSAGNPGFAQVWGRVAAHSTAALEVQSGDTLIGLVKAHYRQQGLPIDETQAFRLAHQVAADNGIENPDRILPGQRIDFARLQLPPLARSERPDWGPSTTQVLASRPWQTPSPVPPQLSAQGLPPSGAATPSATLGAADAANAAETHPVLDRTLQRAVDKGFLAAQDLGAVRERILTLAERYRFAPDDFARLSLMESGGLNPQASNGSCHGIIQFCDGPGRGAASVGFRHNPRAILGLNLLQQLDLVDKYFAQTGLGQGPAGQRIGLDDLYLTVLTPAARAEKRRDAPLDIAGPQASYLHVDRDRQKPITRNSILEGLQAYTQNLLYGRATARSGVQQYAQTLGTWPR